MEKNQYVGKQKQGRISCAISTISGVMVVRLLFCHRDLRVQSEIKQNVAKLEENSFLQRSKVVDFIDFFIFFITVQA